MNFHLSMFFRLNTPILLWSSGFRINKKHSFIVGSASFVKHECDNSYDNKNDDYNYRDSTLIASLCVCCFYNIIGSTISTIRTTITIVLAFCRCTFSCCRFWGSSENIYIIIYYDNIYYILFHLLIRLT